MAGLRDYPTATSGKCDTFDDHCSSQSERSEAHSLEVVAGERLAQVSQLFLILIQECKFITCTFIACQAMSMEDRLLLPTAALPHQTRAAMEQTCCKGGTYIWLLAKPALLQEAGQAVLVIRTFELLHPLPLKARNGPVFRCERAVFLCAQHTVSLKTHARSALLTCLVRMHVTQHSGTASKNL